MSLTQQIHSFNTTLPHITLTLGEGITKKIHNKGQYYTKIFKVTPLQHNRQRRVNSSRSIEIG